LIFNIQRLEAYLVGYKMLCLYGLDLAAQKAGLSLQRLKWPFASLKRLPRQKSPLILGHSYSELFHRIILKIRNTGVLPSQESKFDA